MAPQTAISKAVCYKTKNEQLWEKAVHFLLVATNWFYASLPTVFCTITENRFNEKISDQVQKYVFLDRVCRHRVHFCRNTVEGLLQKP